MDIKQELARQAKEAQEREPLPFGGVKESSHGIRLLKASEIECRVARVTEKGVSLLLYKDARVDQKILDETFGMFGWKRSHQMIDGNLYCTVEIYDERTGQWVAKQDVGIAGFSEKEKAQASDSFKRACFNWGIGRELYSAPFIWIPAEQTRIQNKDGKFYCNDDFYVSLIGYNAEREINALMICNKKGVRVFNMGKNTKLPDAQDGSGKLSADKLTMLMQELKRTGVDLDMVRERYPFQEVDTITEATYQKIMKVLKKMKSAVA